MASVLVAFASHDGQTRKIAERIATVLRARRHAVELLDLGRTAPRTLDLSRFQAVVIGSPIRAQGYLRPVLRFVRTHRAQLERLPTLFLSVGLAVLSKIGDGRAQTMRIVEKLVAETGWHPGRIELVAGALKYTRYNFLVRFLMRRISRKEGGETDTSRDHEYTDWTAVDRFAVDLVDRLEEGPHPADASRLPPALPA